MKIKSIILAAVVALFATSSLSAKSLVIYFSRADENYGVGNITEGNTAILAKMIAQKTGSDIFEIVPEKAYPKSYNECTTVAKDEQRKKARPAYKGDIDTSAYDTIYIGYPIWWGDLPMVVYTFLEAHDLSGKTIIPFCTHEGSGLSGTDNNIKKLCPDADVAKGLAINGSSCNSAETSVKKWLSSNGL